MAVVNELGGVSAQNFVVHRLAKTFIILDFQDGNALRPSKISKTTIPKMQKSSRVSGDKEPIRQQAAVVSVPNDDDDEDLSFPDHDTIDLDSVPKVKKSVKDFVNEKKAAINNFDRKEFVETNKLAIATFSLDEWMSDKRKILIKATAGEFLVTTLFLFIVCAAGLNLQRSGHSESEALVASALCTGFAAVALIYSFADVSGAHFNPAVTFATIVTRKTSLLKGSLYMMSQLTASLMAMILLSIAFPKQAAVAGSDAAIPTIPQELVIVPGNNWGRAFVMEFLLTFILVYVIFATAFDTVPPTTSVRVLDGTGAAVNKRAKNLTIYTASGNTKAGFAPLAIGLTLGFLCFLGGSVSGGAFNPARVFGAGICAGPVFAKNWASMWLYFAADFLGAGAAGLVQQSFFATKHEEQAPQEQPSTSAAIPISPTEDGH
eukprot:Partr_v1_DN26309_c0_g1_i1_m42934 putative Aquaporin